MIYLMKYWKPAAVAVLLLLAAASCRYGQHTAYKRGYVAATAEISAELAKAAKKQAEQAHAASRDYQTAKAEQNEKERIRYVEVQKIIKQPVYRNVCLDDHGLRIINGSADGK